MSATFLTGLVLGLGLIVPIGAQNVFVFGQGLAVGMPRALWAVVAAACCDTILIVAGAAGAAALVTKVPGLRYVLLVGGAAFLGFLGVRSLRAKPSGEVETAREVVSVKGVLARTAMVSLLNPHAIFDTVVVIGAAIAAQRQDTRLSFALGTVSASWLWFLVLAVAAAGLRGILTDRRRVWFDRASGVVLLVFSAILLVEFVNAIRDAAG
ncbi:hypothetical protein Afil01_50830 [Actinorhabdospora filicis]|uniref:L-lysine exporter family protein LysE/ArgO n=1 Tax=Actinorhabdospora filicis TaxID=1785913 RepID=A0A9W6ST51_9ACTN|nr:LysE family transporter [Actinorhabdospora filicis]GLZ80276.1 hypothetical protein Afil01_50830 [Actinorhabdospora filicis]